MESLKLEGEIIEQKARNESQIESQVKISYEFRAPLNSSLMLLENLLLQGPEFGVLIFQYVFDARLMLW